MKLRYIFTALAAAALAFVGCQEEERFLDEVKVSESIVAIPITGGEAKLTINATADWSFVETKLWPEEVTKDKDGNETRKPSWVTVDVTSGGAGETEVTISAEEASANRELNLYVACAGVQQTVKVVQMAERVPAALATCKQVLDDHAAGVAVGKTYKVKGTVTDITNYGKYGCFYVNDGTGQVYVYGSMNPDQFDPSVGDIITFEGPWTSYGNFDDVTILELEKSLLKVEKVTPEAPVALEGGKVTVTLTIKAKEFEVVIPEDAQEWLTYDEEKDVMVLGETTYIFDFTLAPNEAGARKTTVTFVANVDGVDYSAAFEVEQLGAIAKVTVADFLAAPEGTALYELTGVVKNLANTTYGNFDLVDATGSVYVYGLTNNGAIGSNDKKFAEIGINEGDVITIIGTRTSYKETPQVGGTAYLKEHVVAAKAATVAEFLAQPKGTWCKMTATLSNLKSDVYGNFDLVDETGSVYVYGLTSSFVAKNDKSFASLDLKEGDIVTLVGKRDSYNDQEQVGGPAYYVSHVAGSTEPEEPETPVTPPAAGSKYVKVTADQADWSGKYLIVFGSNAHASLTSKDLNSTVPVTIVNDEIEAKSDLAPAVMTVVKNGDKYNMTFADGKYFGMQHNGCKLMDSAFELGFAYTDAGVKISGQATKDGATNTYFLYENASASTVYYRCYVEKNGQSGYNLPALYKLAE